MNRSFIRISLFLVFVSLSLTIGFSATIAGQTKIPPVHDFSGTWTLLTESNPPGYYIPMTMEIHQNGMEITGKAMRRVGEYGQYIDTGTVHGSAFTFSPLTAPYSDFFQVEIAFPSWGGDMVRVYQGELLPYSKLSGRSWLKVVPGDYHYYWKTDNDFPKSTLPRSSAAMLDSGKKPTLPRTADPRDYLSTASIGGNSRPANEPTPPYIIARAPVIPTPVHPFAIVVLAWDAGPGHPNVEVVMSIDNGAEIAAFSMEQSAQSPVWKQAKTASIPLQLQRYHFYKFVLKDVAGKTLASIAFAVP